MKKQMPPSNKNLQVFPKEKHINQVEQNTVLKELLGAEKEGKRENQYPA